MYVGISTYWEPESLIRHPRIKFPWQHYSIAITSLYCRYALGVESLWLVLLKSSIKEWLIVQSRNISNAINTCRFMYNGTPDS